MGGEFVGLLLEHAIKIKLNVMFPNKYLLVMIANFSFKLRLKRDY